MRRRQPVSSNLFDSPKSNSRWGPCKALGTRRVMVKEADTGLSPPEWRTMSAASVVKQQVLGGACRRNLCTSRANASPSPAFPLFPCAWSRESWISDLSGPCSDSWEERRGQGVVLQIPQRDGHLTRYTVKQQWPVARGLLHHPPVWELMPLVIFQ